MKLAAAKIMKDLSKLHALPSGFRLLEATSLTLSTTMAPDLRGGCGKYLSDQHKAAERRGLFAIMADDAEDEEHVTCFRDAMLFSGLYFKYYIYIYIYILYCPI